MKVLKKLMVVLVILFSFSSVQAFATTLTQDGLEVTLTTNKEKYSKNEQITATLTVKNTNDSAISNISLENLIPDGYKLADKSEKTKQIGILNAGEIASLEVTYVVDSKKTDDETNKIDDPSKTDEANKIDDPSKTDEANKIDEGSTVNNTSVSTGDDFAMTTVLSVLAISSIALIIVVSIKKKKGKQLLSLFLSVSIIGAINVLPVSLSYAAEENSSVKNDTFTKFQISLKQNVNVEDKVVNIKSIVYYSLPNYEEIYNEKFYDNDKLSQKESGFHLLLINLI